ncbi:hypothetical protein [Bradyrhizobium elkanii]|uniref:Nutrient deprivation-induced protein n=1 Tax=Bradyrhizobium elkanii TaxID=29448 RepID=A0A8I1Y6D4_BRAEL|nr:hypothetical protein [Bradyrhizobium elkanii]MBP1294238.1 hypothetical protein [Bradyrhizobium elkanii]
MSDLDLNQRNSPQKPDAPLSERLKDQMQDAGAQMKERAGDALRASTDTAREKFGEAADAAKGVASEAVDQFQDRARDQQQSGADFIERFAGNIREAARAFENDAPFAARGINSAADYVKGAGEKIRDGSFRDLVDNATGFARRQPAAFLGLSVLAGFAAVRFLRASDGGPLPQGADRSSSGKDETWANEPGRNRAS